MNGNVTLGNAAGDTVTIAGDVTMSNGDLTLTAGGITTNTSIVSGTTIYAGASGTSNIYAGNLLMGDDPGEALGAGNVQGISLYGNNTSGYAVIHRYGTTQTAPSPDAALFLGVDYIVSTAGQLLTWQAVKFRRVLVSGNNYVNVGYIQIGTAVGTAPAFFASSDYRFKSNIRNAADSIDFLAKINALRPVLYNTDTGTANPYDQLGYIAHEVQAVIPEAVSGEKDAVDENGDPVYQSMGDAFFMPYVVGAIQKLSSKIDALESRVAELESQ
jgi:hypothetical protein